MPDEPRWGPATTYRSSPHLRRDQGPSGRRTREEAEERARERGAGRPPAQRGGSQRPDQRAGQRPGQQVGQRPDQQVGQRPGQRAGRERYAEAGADEPGARGPGGGGSRPSRGRSTAPLDRPRMSPARRRGLVRLGVIGALLLVVLAVVVYPLLLARTGYSSIHRMGALPTSTLADTPGRTVLMVGTDSRANLTRDQQVQLSTGGDAGGDRTDTIMILHRPANGGPVVLLSIPRDSYVAIPGHGKSKINAAYSWGGASLLVQTVEQATGLRIDGYAETGLGGFAGMVDAVGGVTMCPTKAIKDVKAGLDIQAGCQTMGGATALGYARSRDYDANGDLGRAERQRQLIAAIAKKAASPTTLANPFRAFPLAKAGGGALTVDDSFGPGDLLSFVRAMKSVAGGQAVSLNVPVATANLRTSSGVAVKWDATQAAQVFADIESDDTAALRAIAASEPAVAAAAAS